MKDGGGWSIRLGDKAIAYVESFRFFMTTTMPNPHYPPEISVKARPRTAECGSVQRKNVIFWR